MAQERLSTGQAEQELYFYKTRRKIKSKTCYFSIVRRVMSRNMSGENDGSMLIQLLNIADTLEINPAHVLRDLIKGTSKNTNFLMQVAHANLRGLNFTQ
jgi:hypothetical protein